jgi:hypothetical protein
LPIHKWQNQSDDHSALFTAENPVPPIGREYSAPVLVSTRAELTNNFAARFAVQAGEGAGGSDGWRNRFEESF